MKYITLFETIDAYNAATLALPNVSLIEETMSVGYKPYVPETRLVCKYTVTDTSNSIKLYYSSSGSGSSGSGSGSDSEDTSMFSLMEVDGTEMAPTSSYTFNTTGEHTVLFTLAEGVTSIDENAFKDCNELTNVTIPDLVTSISSNAFYYCSSLISVTIGNSVTSIGDYAFESCSRLASITIPNSVTSIGDGVFRDCSGLTSISVDANNQIYDSRNNCNAIIETSTNKLILGCKNTIIPDSVILIGNSAFCGCSELTSITIPDSITSIGYTAFKSCSGLTSITIPDSVTSIGTSAFSSCYGLTSITIGNSVTSIGDWTFESCRALISITCNATTAPIIESNTFYNIKSGGTLTVPVGSTGYDAWMTILGNGWTKVEA